MDFDERKFSELDRDTQIGILAFIVQEGFTSMKNRDGLRSGLYLRLAKQALDLTGVKAIPLDDIDLESDTVYIAPRLIREGRP